MFCAPASAIAESYYAYGIGMNQSKNGVKIINLGFREDLFLDLAIKLMAEFFMTRPDWAGKAAGLFLLWSA